MIFSPTRTQKYLRCPLMVRLDDLWQAPETHLWNPALLMGTAAHEGVRAWWQGTGEWIDVAMACLEGGWVENPKWSLEALTKMLAKGVKLLVEGKTPFPGMAYWKEHEALVQIDPGHKQVVEGDDPGHPDLLTEDPRGLIVTDIKTSFEVDSRWLPRRLQEYDASFQMWFNAWRAEQVLGKPVAEVRVQHLVFSPLSYNLVSLAPTPERFNHFLPGAKDAWDRMLASHMKSSQGQDDVSSFPPNYENCWGKYGRCRFYAACHEHGLDEPTMTAMGWVRRVETSNQKAE